MKKNSETMSTLPFKVISVLLSVALIAVMLLLYFLGGNCLSIACQWLPQYFEVDWFAAAQDEICMRFSSGRCFEKRLLALLAGRRAQGTYLPLFFESSESRQLWRRKTTRNPSLKPTSK